MTHRIKSIEGFVLSCDLPQRMGNARVMFDKRSALLLRITTSSGFVGWGETWAYPDAAGAIIRSRFGPALLGSEVTTPATLIAPLLQTAAQDRRGLHHMAASALDIAIWDAYGRVEAKPIYQLLGGARRASVMAYASGPLLRESHPYADLERVLGDCLDQGFKAFKLRIGIDRRSDEEALRRARALIGPDAMLMADMNEAGSVKEAVALAQAVGDLDLSWLEEPVPHDNFPAYQRLAKLLPISLSGGESLYGLAAFRDVVAQGGLEIIQPDLALCGGFEESRKIAALAEAFGLPVVPHVWGAGINYLASLQFVATLPALRIGRFHYPLHEVDVGYNPLRSSIIDLELDQAGCLKIPDGPGLGIEIDPSRFEKFIVDRWTVE